MIAQPEQATIEYLDSDRETGVRLQTFARSYAQILAGDDPWLPLGNMMHQFFGAYKHLAAALVADPLVLPADVSPEHFRWAAFCAASVEYLCRLSALSCPAWALDMRFALTDPWFLGIGADLPKVQEKLRQTTPEEFTRRGIFCGNRVYNNKYEYRGRKTA